MARRASKLFIGVGNVLRRDDGVGVRAAEVMANLSLPPNVEVFDGGTLGLETASIIEHRHLVVVADAIDARAEPGAVFKLTPEELLPYLNMELSLHDSHFLNALDETRLRGTAPHKVVVLAVQVGDVSFGLGLSPRVEASLYRVLELGLTELGLSPTILDRAAVGASSWAS